MLSKGSLPFSEKKKIEEWIGGLDRGEVGVEMGEEGRETMFGI